MIALLGFIALVILYACWLAGREKVRWWREDYRIEYISPGILRGEEGEFALDYHTTDGKITFTGIGKIELPNASDWPDKVPPWARAHRAVIVRRLKQHYWKCLIER